MGRRRWDLGGAARDEHGDRVLEDERRLGMAGYAQCQGIAVVAVQHATQLLATLQPQRDRLPRIRFSQPFWSRNTGVLLPPGASAGAGMIVTAGPCCGCSMRAPPAAVCGPSIAQRRRATREHLDTAIA